jgi:hypothetical protein
MMRASLNRAAIPILVSLAFAQPMVSSAKKVGGQQASWHKNQDGEITIRLGRPLRTIPFHLNLRHEEAPTTISGIVEELYAAIPEDRLKVISYFFGGSEFERFRSRYPSMIDFYHDLYIEEILDDSGRRWRNSDRTRLQRSRDCVGPNYAYLVALQIGVKYRELHHGRDEALSDLAQGFGQAAGVARRLFEICDRFGLSEGR